MGRVWYEGASRSREFGVAVPTLRGMFMNERIDIAVREACAVNQGVHEFNARDSARTRVLRSTERNQSAGQE